MADKGPIQLSDDSKRAIESILRARLEDGEDEIGVEELEDFLFDVGFCPTREDVEFLVKHFDENGDGSLEVKELLDNLDILSYHSMHGTEMMNAFKVIDKNGDGYIRYPEMLAILTLPGPNQMEVMEARRLVDHLARKYDTNRDGKFSYSEFVKMYMSDDFMFKQPEIPTDETDATKPTKKKFKKKKSSRKLIATEETPDGSVNESTPPTSAAASANRESSAGSANGTKSNPKLRKKSSTDGMKI